MSGNFPILRYCEKKLNQEFSQTNLYQLEFWTSRFGMQHGRGMAVRMQVITSYLEHFQLLLIVRPDQFTQFLKNLKKRREKMEVRKRHICMATYTNLFFF